MKFIKDDIIQLPFLNETYSNINTIMIDDHILFINNKGVLGWYSIKDTTISKRPNHSLGTHKLTDIYTGNLHYNVLKVSEDILLIEYITENMVNHPAIRKLYKKDDKWVLDKNVIYMLQEGPDATVVDNMIKTSDEMVLRLSRSYNGDFIDLQYIDVKNMNYTLSPLTYNEDICKTKNQILHKTKDGDIHLMGGSVDNVFQARWTNLDNEEAFGKLNKRVFNISRYKSVKIKDKTYLFNNNNHGEQNNQKIICIEDQKITTIINKKKPLVMNMGITVISDDKLYRLGVMSMGETDYIIWEYDLKE